MPPHQRTIANEPLLDSLAYLPVGPLKIALNEAEGERHRAGKSNRPRRPGAIPQRGGALRVPLASAEFPCYRGLDGSGCTSEGGQLHVSWRHRDVNRELAHKINEEALRNPQSPYSIRGLSRCR